MLINEWQYELTIWIWLGIAAGTFLLLMFVRAPYGRHERPGWGPRIPARLGWVFMESPCIVVMTVFFGIGASGWNLADPVGIIFYILWTGHYIHRSWVWPARARITGKKMPISLILFAVGFNGINAWINAEWMFSLHHPYPIDWLISPQFIIGVIFFITGMGINIKSDNMLFDLRRDGSAEYQIPRGGLFQWISCPNYLGELLEWWGWALATWSLAGLSFAVWGMANLVPRARANHKWYQKNFKDYPVNRKALIPKVW